MSGIGLFLFVVVEVNMGKLKVEVCEVEVVEVVFVGSCGFVWLYLLF